MGIRQLLRDRTIASIVAVYGSFLLVLLVYSLFPGGTQAETGAIADFSFENLRKDGSPISLEQYKGKHVLVYFFSSW